MCGRLSFYLFLPFVLLSSLSMAGQTLYLGSVGDDPDKELREFYSLATYLEKQLHPNGVDRVVTLVASSTQEMVRLVAKRKVHLYIDSPFPSLIVSNKAGSTIFLRRWKKGLAKYRSVVFARKDSGIDSLNAMQGRLMAFEEPFSTSSYFLPKATLLDHGMSLQGVRLGDSVPADKVGYVFSDDDQNTMLWVLRKKVDIGAMSERSYRLRGKKRLSDLNVIVSSVWVPRHVVSHQAGMDPLLVDRIKQVLLDMEGNDEGRLALKLFSNTIRFDEFPDGVESHMAPIKNLLKYR